MADISRREMALIIGLVVGTLFLTLIVVLAYIMYDRQRANRAGMLYTSRGGPNLPSSPPAGVQRWTTINNSMVGLEICDTPTSHARSVDANSGSFPPPMNENGATENASSCRAGNHKSLLASLFGWIQLLHQPRLRSSGKQDSNGGRRMAIASEVSSAAPAAPVPAACNSKHQRSLLRTAKSIPSSVPTSGVVRRADPGLAMVLVELNATSAAGSAPVSPGPTILPVSVCIGDSEVGVALEPSSSSSVATDATVSVVDVELASSSAELLLSVPLDAISAPMMYSNGGRAKGKGGGGADSKRNAETISDRLTQGSPPDRVLRDVGTGLPAASRVVTAAAAID
ncbi:hypothetical protein Vretimale_15213 [Volvox reticuliferus]|uniref:Uncharacterized protein n=1 Tax=Volvox reticuliferus TaxID=1737510 RepID=A0A8J4LVZ2_9CHLO|nr:hypothetical protein Vretifemale_5415 [Volvox reticuliferus]GIM11758.1 hypothetical protein Vretimale_15213 [Volvox reticuliferus]